MHPKAAQIAAIADAVRHDALLHAGRVYCGLPVGKGGKMTGSSRQAIVADHFRNGNQARYGFPALSPKYAKWKSKKFPGRPMLVRSGRLRQHIVGRGSVHRTTNGIIIRWRVPAYTRHLIAQGRHPARPDSADKAAIVDAARRYIRQVIKAKVSGYKRRVVPKIT